jgi:hypothetical protein
MRLIIRHLFRDLGNYYVTTFLNNLYSELLIRYPDYEFIIQNDKIYENNGYGGTYSCMNFSVINPETEKYILVSFFDNWKYLFMKHMGWDPNKMTQFFYCGGFNYMDYFNWKYLQKDNADVYLPYNIDTIYQSFFYGPYYANRDTDVDEIYNLDNIKQSIPQLSFRGYMWDFRQDMLDDLNDESITIIDKNSTNNNLNYIEYLQDLTKYRCALSLPGGTEICNRDIECFSIGVPVIRPNLSINYPDPLIANYHYISCYDNCKYWSGNPTYLSYKDFQESLKDCWHRVRDNLEYLEFVANNARRWYLKNCTLTQNIKYVLSKLDLEALNG